MASIWPSFDSVVNKGAPPTSTAPVKSTNMGKSSGGIWPSFDEVVKPKTKEQIQAEQMAEHAKQVAQAKAQSSQIDVALEKEAHPGVVGSVKNFFGAFTPNNIKNTAVSVGQDIKSDPLGTAAAIPRGLFDAGGA